MPMLRQLWRTLLSPKEAVFRSSTEAEEKLEFSELRYRRLFETAQDGILILDADSGKIEDVNPFLKELLGYSQAELVGRELWEIGVFKDIIDSKKAFLELQVQGYIRYKDLPLQTKSGRSIAVEFVSNVYMVKHQKVIQCNIRDISDRKKVETAMVLRTKELEMLTTSQEETKKAMLNVMEDLEFAKSVIETEKAKDEAILASIGEGLIAFDTNRRILIVNRMAESLLDVKSEDLVGKIIDSLPLMDLYGQMVPMSKRPATIAITSGKSLSSSAYFFLRGGKTRFPIGITATPIKLNGEIIGAIDVFRDITAEKETDKAKSEFVSLASHQLRTPLGITKWYLEALVNEDYFTKVPVIMRKYLAEIYKSNERVLSLVRDLLSVSRIDQAQVKNEPTSVDVIQVVKDLVEQMKVMALQKQVALQLTIKDESIPAITIDALRFYEALENLITNAIEYTLPSGTVTVTVTVVSSRFFIRVQDTGIGISVSDQKNLFTKFFRSEQAIKSNPEGSGLGLYVVKSYVEGWGGTMSVESVEGKGSIFTLSLPISVPKRG